MRLLPVLALLLLSLTVRAAAPYGSYSHHLRVEPARTSAASLAMAWGDSCLFSVEVPPLASADDIFGTDLTYRYSEGDSLLRSGTLRLHPKGTGALSVVLNANYRGAWVDVGSQGAELTVPVRFNRTRPDSVAILNPGNLRIVRNTITYDTIPAARFISPDSCTALWRYLDRNNDGRRAYPATYYRLGSRTLEDGAIALVILSEGDYDGAADWPVGRIKAILRPTGFKGHYDLEWLRADGRLAPPESYADLDEEQGILTLSFPLLDTTFRLARITK